jgi:hypothetical protein
VCLLPGTELAFAAQIACLPAGLLGWKTQTINHETAIFRQVNKDKLAAHHDALEFPDGRTSGGDRAATAGEAGDRGRGARTGTRRLSRLRRVPAAQTCRGRQASTRKPAALGQPVFFRLPESRSGKFLSLQNRM